MKVAMLLSRVRVEEKLLIKAFEAQGVDVELIDDRKLILELRDSAWMRQFDVVVDHCITP